MISPNDPAEIVAARAVQPPADAIDALAEGAWVSDEAALHDLVPEVRLHLAEGGATVVYVHRGVEIVERTEPDSFHARAAWVLGHSLDPARYAAALILGALRRAGGE